MILIKGNVERIAETDAQIERLKKLGFKEIEDTGIVKDESGEQKSIQDMNVTQLKAIAKEKGIDGTSSLTKEELLEVLKDVI